MNQVGCSTGKEFLPTSSCKRPLTISRDLAHHSKRMIEAGTKSDDNFAWPYYKQLCKLDSELTCAYHGVTNSFSVEQEPGAFIDQVLVTTITYSGVVSLSRFDCL